MSQSIIWVGAKKVKNENRPCKWVFLFSRLGQLQSIYSTSFQKATNKNQYYFEDMHVDADKSQESPSIWIMSTKASASEQVFKEIDTVVTVGLSIEPNRVSGNKKHHPAVF